MLAGIEKMARLGDMLVSEGLLTKEQLDEALQAQKAGGGFLGDVLLQKRLLTEPQLVEVLARQTGSPAIDVSAVEPEPDVVAKVPADLARRHRCVPVKQNGKIIHVAMVNPQDDRALDDLSFKTGCTIKTFVAGPQAIEAALARVYGDGAAKAATAAAAPAEKKAKPAARGDGRKAPKALPTLKALDTLVAEAVDQVVEADPRKEADDEGEVVDLEAHSGESPVVRLVNALLVKSVLMRASDVHIEPQEKSVRVRFRIDGALVEVASLPAHVRQALLSRIKIMSNMDIAERRIPQDGRIKIRMTETQAVDFRVNALPSVHGEKIVLRLLGQGQLSKSIEDLGFSGRNLELMREAVRNPFGMILVTGPTGSGKNTKLYTILSELNDGEVNIVTAEDPVEYHLAGITQVNVRAAIGFTFDVALRAFLRQDPDIILVGEVRDFETAAIATKAALTGHLVLSTLHTNDCPSTVVRLVDMGIEPYLVASAVKIVVAQRLVRRICAACREEVPLDAGEKQDLSQSVLAALEHRHRGRGCDQCNGLGYKGRAPVYEVMAVRSKEMKRVITEGGTEIQVAQVARREGMRTLKDEALRLVNEGVTSLEEALEIIMAE
jgi:type IV pilus assembly protein PilB